MTQVDFMESMSVPKYVIGCIMALLLVTAALVIISFDATNVDIARPPSLDRPGPFASGADATSFIADPLNRYAVYQLGRASTDPDPSDSSRLIALAAERSRRDAEIQTAALGQILKEENYMLALERLDGLIRSRPALRYKLFDVLAELARNTGGQRALADVLTQDPPWRKTFFTYLPRSAADLPAAAALVTMLRQGQSPPRPDEMSPLLNKLIQEGAGDQAYALWLNSLTEDQLARAGYIYNGDFEAKLARQGSFDWVVLPAKNIVVRTTHSGSSDHGSVLELAFAGSQIAYRNVSQRLMLPPGRYSLTGTYRANNLDNERGLMWRVYCGLEGPLKLAQGPAMNGTRDWTPFQTAFVVPDEACPTQALRLELDARAKLDLKVSGVIRFDDLRIDRQE